MARINPMNANFFSSIIPASVSRNEGSLEVKMAGIWIMTYKSAVPHIMNEFVRISLPTVTPDFHKLLFPSVSFGFL